MKPDISVTFTGLKFTNPFLLSSAPPTESDSNIMRAFEAGWGGVVTKTIGLHPVTNVAGPKTKFLRSTLDGQLSMQKRPETALHSSWNWELISDKPLDWWIPKIAGIKKAYPDRMLIASIMAGSGSDKELAHWQTLAKACQDEGADAFELNLSCPHMDRKDMGSNIGKDQAQVSIVTEVVKEVAKVPVWAKLTPSTTDIVEEADAAFRGGADAIVSSNTFPSLPLIDPETLDFEMNVDGLVSSGGLGGPAILPQSLAKMSQLTNAFPDRAFSGIGGVSTVRARAQLPAARLRHRAGVHGGDARPRDRSERDQGAARGHAAVHGKARLPIGRGLPRLAPRQRGGALADSTAGRQGVPRRTRRRGLCELAGQQASRPQANRDFVELTEDVSSSPLWNPDLAPTSLASRTWSTYHIAALWIGMSVVITTYTLASGLMQQGMTWSQALVTILLGNAIVLVPMILNAHAGTKYGVSFPVLCRAAFGVKGANVPAILRAIVACGWFGIQTWIGALALQALLVAAWGGWANVAGGIWISFAIFWLVQVAIIIRGLEGIKMLESWSAPLLLGGGVALLIWAINNGGGLGRILSEAPKLQQGSTPFWTLFPAALTANVGYWATLSLNIPDFTRYAKSQRSQALGQALGLPATMTAFAFLGVAVTSATIVIFGEAIWDPVVLIARIGSPMVVIFGALVILAAQITTNMAANVVSPANDFSSLAPKKISYVTGGLITAALGIVMMPWKLYADASAYIFTWLIGYSSLMGAVGGILIADYWLLRGRNLSLPDLFKLDGRYSYSGGVNRKAMIALIVSILPVIPGFARAAMTPGRRRGQPDLLRSPLHLRMVRDVRAQRRHLPCADGKQCIRSYR